MEKNHGDAHHYTLERLKELRAVHRREVKTVADAAKNLRDEAEIFVDILPSYKIKELTESEKAQMKSKEVRSLQGVEQNILFYYRKFLGNLVSLAHKKSDDTQFMAVSCLCEILPSAQDFNFGSSVIDTIVDRCNSRVPRMAAMCIKSIRTLLSSPTPTDAVLSCLQCISDSVKERGHLVNHRLLASLQYVRIKNMDVYSRDIAKEKKQLQQRKKTDKATLKTMERGEASMNRVQLSQLMTKMLNKVLTTYLRTLELCKTAPRYRQSMLLGPTMEGLAKFAHLIDFSLFELLLEAIGDILASPTTTIATSLNGIITVATLANQAQQQSSSSDGVSVDIAPYYETLYGILPSALDASSHHDLKSKIDQEENQDESPEGDAQSTAVSMIAPRGKRSDPPRNTLKERTERAALVLKACDLMLLVPRKVSMQRVSAFHRRLELLAVHSPPHIAVSVLAFCHKLFARYPNLALLHDGNEDLAGGAYDPDVDIPDHTNAMASVSWEVNLLRSSYNPFLREYASTMLKQHKGLATNANKHATLNPVIMGCPPEKGIRTFDPSSGGFHPLPLEVNKKMDRALLKRRQDALLQAKNTELGITDETRPKKKRKVTPAAIEAA